MLEWESVIENKELIEQVERLVNEVADEYFDFPQDICDELNELTGNSWYCSNKECYGYEKDIYIYNSYDNKFLNCTITNLSDVERESFMDIMRKWCSHVEKA